MTDPTMSQPDQPKPGYPPYGGYPAPRHGTEPATGELHPVHPPPPSYAGQHSYPQSAPYPPPPAQAPFRTDADTAYQYGYPNQPAFGPPPEPPKKPRTWLWAGLAAFVVLALAGAAAAIVALRNNNSDPVTAPPSASASPTEASPSPTPDEGEVATLTLPDTLAGLTKSESAQFTSLLDTMIEQLKSGMPGATDVGAGIYSDPNAAEKLVMVVQMKGDFPLASVQVDGMLGGMGIGGLKVTDVKAVNAGSAGGTVKCGKGDVNGVSMTVCAWGDDGEMGMAVFYFRTQSQSTTLLTNIRKGLA